MTKNKPQSFFLKLLKAAAIIWILSLISFLMIIFIATSGFSKTVDNTKFGNSGFFLQLMIIFILIGSLAFLFLILGFIAKAILEKKFFREFLEFKKSFKGIVVSTFKLFFVIAIFPLFLIYNESGLGNFIGRIRKKPYSKPKPLISRLILVVLISVTFLPVWVVAYLFGVSLLKEELGYVTEPITVAGTGSMFPTFPKGEGKSSQELAKQVVGYPGMSRYPNGINIGGKRFFEYQIGRGDIVVIENEKIREMNQELFGTGGGWVKRIIGLPGDNIELKNGIVYLNDEPLKEPYIAKARSTFGESFLSECKKLTIPENSVFVMGDNRKGSGDSREIGFINIEAINHVLPLEKQKSTLDKNWRDTSKDLEESSKIKLDKGKYLDLLNQERGKVGVKPLKYQSKLEKSALKRGEIILKYDDFSYEATRSGYTQLKAMNEAGYSNITYGEAPTLGYFEADELIENQFESPESKKFLLNKDFQEIGIAEFEGMLNDCPNQVIVQHLAGYLPPNYKQADIDSWKTSLADLKKIQSGWSSLKNYQKFYQENRADVDRINDIISQRITNITAIITRMEDNQWLSKAENDYISQDEVIYKEQEIIATRLNSKH